jgi:nucleosome binding factor SPN SPT16 subunit
MVEGAVAKDVYTHALDYVRRKHPDLEKHFPKNIGFAMGLEFRDSSYVLNAKNTRQLRANMVFNLALGLEGMDEGKGRKYSLLLADTVKVASGRAVLLTDGCKMPKETLFFINQDEKPAAKPAKAVSKSAANGSPIKNKTAGTKVLRTKTRSAAQDDVQRNTTSRIADHQRELFELRQRDGVAKYSEEGDGTGKGEGKQWKRFQSYKGEGGLPNEVESLRVRYYYMNIWQESLTDPEFRSSLTARHLL